MELIIDISEEEYRWIKKSDKNVFADVASKECMLHAIKNAIPLPKGHGDLKDIAEIERLWQKGDYDSLASALIFAPIVIEADKEVENG